VPGNSQPPVGLRYAPLSGISEWSIKGAAVTDAEQLLEYANSVLIVDWPSRDVPHTLARAGYGVVVKGGPEPDDYAAYELVDGEVVARPIGHAPERIDILYCHRPLEELAGIVAMAQGVAARAVWLQSGLVSAGVRDPSGCWLSDDASGDARTLVESAGLQYVDAIYIADTVRRLDIHK
jgi:predicted CoA-binding protein